MSGSTWRRGKRRTALILAIIVAGAAGLYSYRSGTEGSDAGRAAPAVGRAAVPVSVAVVARHDVPIYLTGLGTVQAALTVAIHSQVDGKLQEVLFTEGQEVKKGDVLAKIDPRLFRPRSDQGPRGAGPPQLVGAKGSHALKTLAQRLRDWRNVEPGGPRWISFQPPSMRTRRRSKPATELVFAHHRARRRSGVRLVDPAISSCPAGSITTLALVRPATSSVSLPRAPLTMRQP
jgi:multidrug efflux system membrane fusion protein